MTTTRLQNSYDGTDYDGNRVLKKQNVIVSSNTCNRHRWTNCECSPEARFPSLNNKVGELHKSILCCHHVLFPAFS